MNELSRRVMLKLAGVAGVSLVVPPLVKSAGAVKPPVPKVELLKSKPYEDGETVETDLVIVGTGLGGLWAAVTAADEGVRRIAVVDKGAVGISSGSAMILGGTLYWLDGDDLDACEKEYLEYSAGLAHIGMLRDMLQTSQRRMNKWRKWGLEYDGVPPFGGRFASDGNRHNKMSINPRYREWSCGRALIQCLLDRMEAQGAADHYSKTMITDLLTLDGRVTGAVGVHRVTGNRVVFKTPAVVLATGSCTFGPGFNVSAHHSGDGYGLAYRAGGRLQNLEFLNFDVVARDYNIEGGHLAGALGVRFINEKGRDFMWDYDPKNGTNSSFNKIAFAMADEWAKGNAPIYLDLTTILYKYFFPTFLENFSPLNTWQALNYNRLREIGQPITARPQSHIVLYYGLQGCIRTNDDLMSEEIEGLFAASLSQSMDMCTFKGASSARGMWSGEKVGIASAKYVKGAPAPALDSDRVREALERATAHLRRPEGRSYWELMKKFQGIMFKPGIGLRKTDESLKQGLRELVSFRETDLPTLSASNPHDLVKAHELENMVQLADLYFKASLVRTETRYSHRRLEYPRTDNAGWLRFINWSLGDRGEAVMSFEPATRV